MRKRLFLFALTLCFLTGLAGCRNAARAVESAGNSMENRVESMLTPDPTTAISREEAARIALAHAGLTADRVRHTHTELDYENGHPRFEVEFHYENREYDYEIDAETGEILSFDLSD